MSLLLLFQSLLKQLVYPGAAPLLSAPALQTTGTLLSSGGYDAQIIVEMSTASPFATVPVWVDITPYIVWDQPFWTRRGRQNELQQFQAGTASFTLDNRLGVFDPTNTASPLYPNVKLKAKVRIRAQWNADHTLFTGYVDSWKPIYSPQIGAETIVVTLTDAFKVLNLYKYTGAVPPEATYARAARLLAKVGVPYNAQQGRSTLVAATLAADAISHLHDVETSENGFLFVDVYGVTQFQDRFFRVLNRTAVQWLFGDSSEANYDTLDPSYDDVNLWNEWVVSDSHAGTPNTTTQGNLTSQAAYGKRTGPSVTLLIDSALEIVDHARWRLNVYGTPSLRFDSLTLGLRPDGQDLYPIALAVEIGDRARIIRRPPSGNVIDVQCFVEAVNHDITEDAWTTTLQLSPADLTPVWILQDPAKGVLDSTALPAY